MAPKSTSERSSPSDIEDWDMDVTTSTPTSSPRKPTAHTEHPVEPDISDDWSHMSAGDVASGAGMSHSTKTHSEEEAGNATGDLDDHHSSQAYTATDAPRADDATSEADGSQTSQQHLVKETDATGDDATSQPSYAHPETQSSQADDAASVADGSQPKGEYSGTETSDAANSVYEHQLSQGPSMTRGSHDTIVASGAVGIQSSQTHSRVDISKPGDAATDANANQPNEVQPEEEACDTAIDANESKSGQVHAENNTIDEVNEADVILSGSAHTQVEPCDANDVVSDADESQSSQEYPETGYDYDDHVEEINKSVMVMIDTCINALAKQATSVHSQSAAPSEFDFSLLSAGDIEVGESAFSRQSDSQEVMVDDSAFPPGEPWTSRHPPRLSTAQPEEVEGVISFDKNTLTGGDAIERPRAVEANVPAVKGNTSLIPLEAATVAPQEGQLINSNDENPTDPKEDISMNLDNEHANEPAAVDVPSCEQEHLAASEQELRNDKGEHTPLQPENEQEVVSDIEGEISAISAPSSMQGSARPKYEDDTESFASISGPSKLADTHDLNASLESYGSKFKTGLYGAQRAPTPTLTTEAGSEASPPQSPSSGRSRDTREDILAILKTRQERAIPAKVSVEIHAQNAPKSSPRGAEAAAGMDMQLQLEPSSRLATSTTVSEVDDEGLTHSQAFDHGTWTRIPSSTYTVASAELLGTPPASPPKPAVRPESQDTPPGVGLPITSNDRPGRPATPTIPPTQATHDTTTDFPFSMLPPPEVVQTLYTYWTSTSTTRACLLPILTIPTALLLPPMILMTARLHEIYPLAELHYSLTALDWLFCPVLKGILLLDDAMPPESGFNPSLSNENAMSYFASSWTYFTLFYASTELARHAISSALQTIRPRQATLPARETLEEALSRAVRRLGCSYFLVAHAAIVAVLTLVLPPLILTTIFTTHPPFLADIHSILRTLDKLFHPILMFIFRLVMASERLVQDLLSISGDAAMAGVEEMWKQDVAWLAAAWIRLSVIWGAGEGAKLGRRWCWELGRGIWQEAKGWLLEDLEE